MINKALGIILLFLGLAIILGTLYFSFNIFTAKAAPPQIFKMENQAASPSQGFDEQIQEIVSEQLKGLIPVDSITTILNLIAWSIFAGILVFAGAHISGLGIKLIK